MAEQTTTATYRISWDQANSPGQHFTNWLVLLPSSSLTVTADSVWPAIRLASHRFIGLATTVPSSLPLNSKPSISSCETPLNHSHPDTLGAPNMVWSQAPEPRQCPRCY